MWPKHSRDLPRNWNRDLSVAYRLLISNVHTVCEKRVNEHRAIVLVSEAAGSVMVRVRVGFWSDLRSQKAFCLQSVFSSDNDEIHNLV